MASDLDGDGESGPCGFLLEHTGRSTVRKLGQQCIWPAAPAPKHFNWQHCGCAADADGDRDNDIATSAFGSDGGWYRNLGNGNFKVVKSPFQTQYQFAYDLNAGDVDGDGDTDLFVRLRTAAISVLPEQWQRHFSPKAQYRKPWFILGFGLIGRHQWRWVAGHCSGGHHDGKLMQCDAATANFSSVHFIAKTASCALKAIAVDVNRRWRHGRGGHIRPATGNWHCTKIWAGPVSRSNRP
ncbi:MAG: VCBS repeat-containing protein [Flavobacteriales bacterium]|nr:VCBS repeat-containing protein [Flavobacteriales bacterium]